MPGLGVGKRKKKELTEQEELTGKVGTGYLSRIGKIAAKREKKRKKLLESME